MLQLAPLVGRDSCALLLARGDQLKPSGSVRGAELLSEPAELENRGFRLAPSSTISSAPPAEKQYREILRQLQECTFLIETRMLRLLLILFASLFLLV